MVYVALEMRMTCMILAMLAVQCRITVNTCSLAQLIYVSNTLCKLQLVTEKCADGLENLWNA